MSGSIFYRKRENGDYVECRNPSSNFGKLLNLMDWNMSIGFF